MAVDTNIKKKANDIRNKVYGKEVRESLASGLEEMSSDVVENEGRQSVVEGRQDSVESQWQSVSDEMTDKDVISAPEIIAARNGAANLKARLDEEHQEVTTQLAQTANRQRELGEKLYNTEINSRRFKKPMITIVDDDGNPRLYSLFKPLIEEYGIKITSAIITSRVGGEQSVNLEQMREMQKLGVEFVSHTHTHPYLATLTNSEIDDELRLAKEWLDEHGFQSNYIVYPFGSVNRDVVRIARKYSRGGIDITRQTNSNINYPPLDTMQVYRSDYDNWDTTQIKAKIDEAISTDGWIVFASHSGYVDWSPTKMSEVIEYALSKGIEFVTLEEGYNQVGNILEFNDVDNHNTATVIDAEGHVHGYRLGRYQMLHSQYVDTLKLTTPITEFIPNAVSVGYVLSNKAATENFPFKKIGIWETHRFANDLFSYQVYRPADYAGKYLIRYWDNTNSVWKDWNEENNVLIKPLDSIGMSVTPANMPVGENTTMITAGVSTYFAASQGFPDNRAGVLYYYPLGAGVYVHQIYITLDSKMYIRFWQSGAWSPFTSIKTGLEKKISKTLLDVGIVPAHSTKELQIYDVDIKLSRFIQGQPQGELPSGINYNVFAKVDGMALLRFTNPTTAAITVPTTTWAFKIAD